MQLVRLLLARYTCEFEQNDRAHIRAEGKTQPSVAAVRCYDGSYETTGFVKFAMPVAIGQVHTVAIEQVYCAEYPCVS